MFYMGLFYLSSPFNSLVKLTVGEESISLLVFSVLLCHGPLLTYFCIFF